MNIKQLLRIAADDGYDAALREMESDYEAEVEGLAADDEDERRYGRDDCPQDSDFDSRGRPLRPKVNDAGEPYWM